MASLKILNWRKCPALGNCWPYWRMWVSIDQYPEWNGEGEAPAAADVRYPALMFRSPAINQAVRAFDADQVKTPWGDDLTAKYMTRLSTMQYTLLSQTRSLTKEDG